MAQTPAVTLEPLAGPVASPVDQDHEFDLSLHTSDTLGASFGPQSQSTALIRSQDSLVNPSPAQAIPPTRSPLDLVLFASPTRSTPLHSPRSTRSQSLAASVGHQSSIKRKPLSPTASLLAVSFSTTKIHHMTPHRWPEPPDSACYSLDSPRLYDLRPGHVHPPVASIIIPIPLTSRLRNSYFTTTTTERPRQTDGEPLYSSLDLVWPVPPQGPAKASVSKSRNIPDVSPTHFQTFDDYPHAIHSTIALSDVIPADYEDAAIIPKNLDNFSCQKFPHIPSPVDRPPDSASSLASLNKPLPKSPPKSPLNSPLRAPKLHGLFPEGRPSPSLNTDYSSKDYSPISSPALPTLIGNTCPDEYSVSTPYSNPIEAQRAHQVDALGYVETYISKPSESLCRLLSVAEIDEMEDELKAISAELASSIRREMDLEDLVQRLQTEIANPQAPGKRTSDYFSDSGYSTAKFSEFDQSKEDVSQVQRKAEQEKAELRLELTSKVQEERGRRNALEQQIKELSQKASQVGAVQTTSKDADARVRELEKTCDNLRRRLSEECQTKDNFEDLLSALRGELQHASLERDNLRDEIVPQLRARVDGLEAQQAESERLAYEATKMQQELQEYRDSKAKNETLTRLSSSSVTGQSFKLGRPPSGHHSTGLSSSSNTVKGGLGYAESREALSERLKDVEAQRDALHSALKNLLDRQEFQNRENEKKIKHLEVERDRLLSASPRKAGFEREVSTLREEVKALRRRAEQAIEQKWEVEKGLTGLKGNLDRAEEEIASLRVLLHEKDVLIPVSSSLRSESPAARVPGLTATSRALENAYKDLQDSYKAALERIKDLEIGGTSASQDDRTRLAMERLEQSLASALHDRDDARLEADALRPQLGALQESERAHLEREHVLADQLRDSAQRVEDLAQQVRAQLDVNADLTSRLSETIARDEAGQKANKERLANMQNRIRMLEEQMIAAQTAAEERVARHEEELGKLREAARTKLRRLSESNAALRSPRLFPPKSPLSPLVSPKSSMRLPRMLDSDARKSSQDSRPSGEQEDKIQIEMLKARVAELEKTLATTDFEMQEVVGRMNTAQIEVMGLLEERETAVRETKKLQKLLEAERVKAFEERFKTMASS